MENKKYHLYKCIAYCWWLIEYYANSLNLQPHLKYLQETSDSLRQRMNLYKNETLEKWLDDNDLDVYSYQKMITAITRFNFLVLQNNLDTLGIIDKEENIWWLLDALWLTDSYSDAKQLLEQPSRLKDIIEQIKQRKDLDQYAYSLDFITGEQEFIQEFPLHF